jgi:hypothetical protein
MGRGKNSMITVKKKLDELIDAEIEHLTSLCLHNNYIEEQYQEIFNKEVA